VVPEAVDIQDAARVSQNVLGCANVLRMAEEISAERFVLVSTDKAVNPSSVMGATKHVAELLVRHRNRAGATRATVVRFGNVLDSAGSVVPIFRQQIARGGPVTVTHPDCLRFVMTLREAVGLTLLAGLGAEGELFVLEMGEPIRILDLARLMITMSGRVPERDVPIEFTGLRPGEKLREELMSEQEAKSAQRVSDGVLRVEGPSPPADLDARLGALAAAAASGDRRRVVVLLSETVLGYEPAGLRLVETDSAAAARGA
jgi:FlaA1/EpsC-like NDP-sugar epimerase